MAKITLSNRADFWSWIAAIASVIVLSALAFKGITLIDHPLWVMAAAAIIATIFSIPASRKKQ